VRASRWLGAGLLAALLVSGSDDPGRAQPASETDLPYDLEDRLQRLEDKLDRLDGLLAPAAKPTPKPPKRPAKPRRPPPPPPVPPAPPPPAWLDPTTREWAQHAPPAPPSRPGWTWEAVDAAQAFRELAAGD
jgi:hypothetical protein